MTDATTATKKPANEVDAAVVKPGEDGASLAEFSIPDGPNTPALINGFNFLVRRRASGRRGSYASSVGTSL